MTMKVILTKRAFKHNLSFLCRTLEAFRCAVLVSSEIGVIVKESKQFFCYKYL